MWETWFGVKIKDVAMYPAITHTSIFNSVCFVKSQYYKALFLNVKHSNLFISLWNTLDALLSPKGILKINLEIKSESYFVITNTSFVRDGKSWMQRKHNFIKLRVIEACAFKSLRSEFYISFNLALVYFYYFIKIPSLLPVHMSYKCRQLQT